LSKALAAINGPIFTRFEGDFARFAAFRADGVVHFAGLFAASFPGLPAFLASPGLIGEAFLGIKFLFARRPDKLFAALLADQYFVLIHKSFKSTERQIVRLRAAGQVMQMEYIQCVLRRSQ
jgi:hypothetical protein